MYLYIQQYKNKDKFCSEELVDAPFVSDYVYSYFRLNNKNELHSNPNKIFLFFIRLSYFYLHNKIYQSKIYISPGFI